MSELEARSSDLDTPAGVFPSTQGGQRALHQFAFDMIEGKKKMKLVCTNVVWRYCRIMLVFKFRVYDCACYARSLIFMQG